MKMEKTKTDRLLEVFFRLLRGEDVSVKELANEYNISTKSVTRTLNDLKSFFADHRELVGNTEICYSYTDKCYRLYMDEFLNSKELLGITKVLIGARAFSNDELRLIISKLKGFTTKFDSSRLDRIIRNEMHHYVPVMHDCDSILERLWQIVTCIDEQKEISIDYYKMDRSFVTHRLVPAAIMFTDYYFYLIAFKAASSMSKPIYFRVDRIKSVTEHRTSNSNKKVSFDEGLLRKRSLFMWPGPLRKIVFEFNGPSLQAVLDKLPTARVVDRKGSTSIIEAETYGDGIKMWLLSQGAWVKVIEPSDFVNDVKAEIEKMRQLYN